MRRALGLALLTGLIGCSSGSTDPSTESLAPGSAQGARAETFTVSQFFEIEIPLFVDCANGGAGENVLLTGVLHDLFHLTINGNKVVIKFHDQPQGISGVGEVSGDVYHATGVTQGTTTIGTIGVTDNFINNFKIIGQRPGNNILIHENVHVTVNANGTLTAFHDHFTADCK